MIIRPARPLDAPALLAIYAPYVEKTAITFEYDVPSLWEFTERIENTLKKYPYLVAEENGQILGYAYAGAFKPRAAYQWAVETTIYLASDAKGKGIGRELYTALEDALRRMNILNACACIAYTDMEDETLTNASMRFHEKMGYHLAAHFHQCGYKFGRWYDMIWMEKMLGEHADHPAPVSHA
ncbi:MAG: N-acetyltransferase [Clostridia bacterium]|nr:N-acetyltransferase [Clostridiales bacterium]MBQ6805094.1 N-acetyltransferase [Clostridia bacterium]